MLMKAKPAMPKENNHPPYTGTDFLRSVSFSSACETLEMVREEFAGFAPGVTEAGAKAQLHPTGSPVQESATWPLNDPDSGVAVTVRFPDCPAGIFIEVGDALREIVAGGFPETHDGL
jgi:hypothetical protein